MRRPSLRDIEGKEEHPAYPVARVYFQAILQHDFRTAESAKRAIDTVASSMREARRKAMRALSETENERERTVALALELVVSVLNSWYQRAIHRGLR